MVTHVMPSSAATSVTSCGTTSTVRLSALTANSSVNMFRPTVYLITRSRSSVVAMMRGVSWPLAIWIATSSEPNVKTTNESVSVMSVWNRVWAPSTPSPVRSQVTKRSSRCSTRMSMSASSTDAIGATQSAERR